MQLWAAALLFIACTGGAAVSLKLYGRSRKARFIALTVTASLLALALIIYIGLTFMLLDGAGR